MFGFQAFTKGLIRTATRCSLNQFSSMKPVALNWSFKQATSLLTRSAPIPGSGLTILNLRQILQKCKQECDSEIDLLANGKYFYEQAVVLSKTSLVDIVGMQNLTQVVSKITRIHST